MPPGWLAATNDSGANNAVTEPKKSEPRTLQLLKNFFIRREAKCFMLAVDQLAIDFHVKNAALAFDKLGINTLGFFNCGRQTGGLWGIVSHHAECDFDTHWNPPV